MRFFRRKRKSGYEDVDPLEFVRRAEAMQLRHDEVIAKVRRLSESATKAIAEGDPPRAERAIARMDDLKAESDLILTNIRNLRLEQIACQEAGWKRRKDPTLGELPL